MSDGEHNKENPLASVVLRLSNIIILLIAMVIVLLILLAIYIPAPLPPQVVKEIVADKNGLYTEAAKNKQNHEVDSYWKAPAEEDLQGNHQNEIILYGKELIQHTSFYYGFKGSIAPSSTNGMNCQNCHLDAGTKVYGNNYALVASTYPKYRPRSGAMENIYKRVNDCFERSLNGSGIDTNSKEMQAIVAYIKWIGSGISKNNIPEGVGMKEINLLDRAADKQKGELVYVQKCKSCHMENGEGKLATDTSGYTYPPLWGKHSYNQGAGLYRLSNFARYVKNNMPFGVTHLSTQLSDEEAWDVAAYVNSQEHPKMKISKDWPNILEKPYDHPFGPYADGFTETQHKYGPFQAIKNKLLELKKNKKM